DDTRTLASKFRWRRILKLLVEAPAKFRRQRAEAAVVQLIHRLLLDRNDNDGGRDFLGDLNKSLVQLASEFEVWAGIGGSSGKSKEQKKCELRVASCALHAA